MVIVGRYTCESCSELEGLMIRSVIDAGSELIDLCVSTAPHLRGEICFYYRSEPAAVDDYYSGARCAFKAVTNSVSDEGLGVDCGNGVCGIAMQEVIDLVSGTILVNAERGADGALLNKKCDAAFARKARTSPTVYTETADSVPDYVIWASLDDYMDRLDCYLRDGNDNFVLAGVNPFEALFALQDMHAEKVAGCLRIHFRQCYNLKMVTWNT